MMNLLCRQSMGFQKKQENSEITSWVEFSSFFLKSHQRFYKFYQGSPNLFIEDQVSRKKRGSLSEFRFLSQNFHKIFTIFFDLL